MALAFDFIFHEISTLSRSKMAAILAKSSKIVVLPGGSKFLNPFPPSGGGGGKNTRSAIALREHPTKADPDPRYQTRFLNF